MRYFFALSIVVACGCAHSPSAPVTDPRCPSFLSDAGFHEVRSSQQNVLHRAADEVRSIADAIDKAATTGLNARNRSERPLSVEETIAAIGRLRGIEKVLHAEHDRLESVATRLHVAPPPPTLPIATQMALRGSACRNVVGRVDAEIASTRSVVTGAMTEFRLVVEEYGLPIRIQAALASPAP